MFVELLVSFVGFMVCLFLGACVIGVVVRLLGWLIQYPFALIVIAVAVAMAIVGVK